MPKLFLFFPKTFDDPAWAGSCYCLDAPDGDHNGKPGEWVLGRHPAADITLAPRTISSRHCALAYSYAAARWSCTDLGSSNGTRINGTLLTPGNPHPVAIGDHLHLGPNRINLVEDEQDTEQISEPTTVVSMTPLDHRTGEPVSPPPPPPPPPPPKTYADNLDTGLRWLLNPSSRLGSLVRLLVVVIASAVVVMVMGAV